MDFFGMIGTVLFISWLDWVAYTLLSLSYSVFLAVSQINIFATEGGMAVFETVSTQLYTVIGVAMIFVFAYQLVLLIINPEGGNQKSPSKLFFDSVISMITVLVLPTVFNYMTVFQEHVLKNGTIPAILLGTSATTDIGDDAGNKISAMVLISFYHPQETTYSTFYGIDGELKSDAVSICTDANGDSEVCQNFYDALADFESDHKIASITGVESLRKAVYKGSESMSYMWVLSTVAAIAVAWFFFTYSIDIGTRAVKLGFLQLIAPAPVILRIFPQTRKTFEMWFGEITKTYIEIFIRLAVIFFIVRLIQIVPDIISAIFSSTSDVVDNVLLQCVAVVILILGLLKFASEAPDLIKNMFNSGGNLLNGMNLKPGVRKHIEENKLGMKGISAGVGAAAGIIGGAGNAINAAKRRTPEGKTVGRGTAFARSLGAGIYGGLRGAVTGAVNGGKKPMEHLSIKDLKEQSREDRKAAQESYNKGTALENVIRAAQDKRAAGGTLLQSVGAAGKKIGSDVEKGVDKIKKNWGEYTSSVQGLTLDKDAKIQLLGNLSQLASGLSTIVDSDGKLQKIKKDNTEAMEALKGEHASRVSSMHDMNLKELQTIRQEYAQRIADLGSDGKTIKTGMKRTFDAGDIESAVTRTESGQIQFDLSKASEGLQAYIKDAQGKGEIDASGIAALVQSLSDGGTATREFSLTMEDRLKVEQSEAIKQKEQEHKDSIAALKAEHAKEIESVKAQHKAAENARIAEIHSSNTAVQQTMESYMSSMNKILEEHAHQMPEAVAAVNQLVKDAGVGAQSLQELTDTYKKSGTASLAPAQVEKLMKDIAEELKLQNSMQALQDKNKDSK